VSAALEVFALVSWLKLGKYLIGFSGGFEGELRVGRARVDQEWGLRRADVFLFRRAKAIRLEIKTVEIQKGDTNFEVVRYLQERGVASYTGLNDVVECKVEDVATYEAKFEAQFQ
jgi:hypothetical protein